MLSHAHGGCASSPNGFVGTVLGSVTHPAAAGRGRDPSRHRRPT